jgi:uncharacterized membrane-anchored protein YjiN (DUF445 family)
MQTAIEKLYYQKILDAATPEINRHINSAEFQKDIKKAVVDAMKTFDLEEMVNDILNSCFYEDNKIFNAISRMVKKKVTEAAKTIK